MIRRMKLSNSGAVNAVSPCAGLKSRAWKSVRKLIEKGLISRGPQVQCFVLGG